MLTILIFVLQFHENVISLLVCNLSETVSSFCLYWIGMHVNRKTLLGYCCYRLLVWLAANYGYTRSGDSFQPR